MLRTLMVVVLAACGRDASPVGVARAGSSDPPRDAAPAADGTLVKASGPLPAHRVYATLAAALRATIPDDARVIGFGELHARTDRARVRSALARFTEALPAFASRVSDLVVETWIVDPKCGAKAVQATARVEVEVKRPVETKSEVTLLAEAARTAKVQPHAMTLTCRDYEHIADPVAMLGVTTRELGRIATSAVAHRDKQREPRRWIAIYGGALHNDRFPDASVAEWSYAAPIDRATDDHFVELDLVVPELAEADKVSRDQPWYPLAAAAAASVLVWERGERSFVVVLPRTPR